MEGSGRRDIESMDIIGECERWGGHDKNECATKASDRRLAIANSRRCRSTSRELQNVKINNFLAKPNVSTRLGIIGWYFTLLCTQSTLFVCASAQFAVYVRRIVIWQLISKILPRFGQNTNHKNNNNTNTNNNYTNNNNQSIHKFRLYEIEIAVCCSIDII